MRKFAIASIAVLGLALGSYVIAADEKEIDDWEWKNWSTCGMGSFVTYKAVTEFSGKEPKTNESTVMLCQVSADTCVLFSTVKSAPKREVHPKVKVPADYAEPKKTGTTEEVELDGKKYKCDIYEHDLELRKEKDHAKTWRCEEVPSGWLKVETTLSGAKTLHSVTTVTAFEKR